MDQDAPFTDGQMANNQEMDNFQDPDSAFEFLMNPMSFNQNPFADGGLINKTTNNKTTNNKEISNFDDLHRHLNTGKNLYVRWSSGPETDMIPGKKSKDYQTGEVHDGLSALKIPNDSTAGSIAKILADYSFISSDGKSHPHIYEGEHVSSYGDKQHDSDGSPVIKPTSHIGSLTNDFSNFLKNPENIKRISAIDNFERSKKINDYYKNNPPKGFISNHENELREAISDWQKLGDFSKNDQNILGSKQQLLRNAFFGEKVPRDAFKDGGSVAQQPSQAQIEAGNYKKKHSSFQGMNVAIENEKGGTRSGVDPNGRRWSGKMPADYGYIKGTTGADKDHVDCYIGDKPDSNHAFIINQRHLKDGSFDEHKVMLGFNSKADAEKTYCRGFSDGKGSARIGSIFELSMPEFKEWIKAGNHKRPFSKASVDLITKALKITAARGTKRN